ncbi:MAG: PorV/PorQ family protein [Elusimicrobia bacterium]|nr:PorV/PorQ family protein [Elusimicrobiota bacterium]
MASNTSTFRMLLGSTLVSACLSGPASATPSGASYLQVAPSARAYALGRSYGITALGAQSMGANPANLGLMPTRFEVFSSFATLLDGSQYGHIAMAFDPEGGRFDGIGLSVTRLQTSGLEEADTNGSLTGRSFGSGDMAVALGGSAAVTPSLRTGLAVKALQSEIAGYRSNLALAGDAGITYTFAGWSRPVSLGASLTNFGQGVRFIEQTDPLPTTANVGVAMPFDRAVFVMEANHLLPERQTQAGLGFEYNLGAIAFRTGYMAASQSGDLARKDEKAGALLGGISGGVGIKFGVARLDYAMSQQAADYGPTQRVALSIQWGGRTPRGGASSRGWGNSPSDWLVRSFDNY